MRFFFCAFFISVLTISAKSQLGYNVYKLNANPQSSNRDTHVANRGISITLDPVIADYKNNSYLTLDNVFGINFSLFMDPKLYEQKFSFNLSYSFIPTYNIGLGSGNMNKKTNHGFFIGAGTGIYFGAAVQDDHAVGLIGLSSHCGYRFKFSGMDMDHFFTIRGSYLQSLRSNLIGIGLGYNWQE